MTRLPEPAAQPPEPVRKAAEETVQGCRDLAAADLARAALMDTANGRHRLENSASSWTNRADMIQDLQDSLEVRQAASRAEWADDETADDAPEAAGS